MKINIKKAPVKFREDLLYFQHLMLNFCLCPKLVIITTLKVFRVLAVYPKIESIWRNANREDSSHVDLGPCFSHITCLSIGTKWKINGYKFPVFKHIRVHDSFMKVI